MTKKLVKLAIYITCILFIAVCLLSYLSDNIVPLKVVSTIASISDILIIVYCKWLWRIKFLNFFKHNDLNGKWECKIVFDSGINYDAGEKKSIWEIKEDLFGIQINMDTNEINSYSVAATIIKEHEKTSLLYMYKTEPSKEFRGKNPDKWGATKLNIKSNDIMEGEYWTNGKTAGRLLLKKIQKTKSK